MPPTLPQTAPDAVHSREPDPYGPDYCRQCGQRLGRTVPWPCLAVTLIAAADRDPRVEVEGSGAER